MQKKKKKKKLYAYEPFVLKMEIQAMAKLNAIEEYFHGKFQQKNLYVPKKKTRKSWRPFA